MTRIPIALIALVLACREPSPRSNAPSAPPPTESPRVSKVTPAPQSQPAREPLPTPAQDAPKSVEGLSEDEIVALLIDSRFQHSTPDASKKALASVGEAKESHPVQTALEVRLDKGNSSVVVNYIQGKTGWVFSDVRGTITTPDEAAAQASYDRFEAQFKKAFRKTRMDQHEHAAGPDRRLGHP